MEGVRLVYVPQRQANDMACVGEVRHVRQALVGESGKILDAMRRLHFGHVTFLS